MIQNVADSSASRKQQQQLTPLPDAASSFAFRNDNKTAVQSPFAYAFLLAGCDANRPEQYRGILFGILVNLEILRQSNSTANVVVYVQMMTHPSTTKTSNDAVLPAKDAALLQGYPRVQISYIPPGTAATTFYQIQFEKFRILQLTQYRRVIYMDADVMPLCSLDYLFSLSMQGVLRENLIIAGDKEPVNGGLFMLRPGEGEYEQLITIVKKRDDMILSSASSSNGSLHDLTNNMTVVNKTYLEMVGWGHVIQPPDLWRSRAKHVKGTQWNFYAAFADQGLLYHWAKYVKMNTTILFRFGVEHWSSSYDKNVTTNTTISLLQPVPNPFKGLGCCQERFQESDCNARDFLEREICHFWGPKRKPWNFQEKIMDLQKPRHVRYLRCYHLWLTLFHQVKQRFDISEDVLVSINGSDPPLGSWATHEDLLLSLKVN
jgi:hypothetical protein